MMNRLIVLFLGAVTGLVLTFVQVAQADEYSSYDEIIRDLRSNSSTTTPLMTDSNDTLSAVKIHAGVALVSSRINLDLPGSLPAAKNLQGVEASFGIDLFSPEWVAEGSVRSFSEEKYAHTKMSLKEFDLKVIHRHSLSNKIFVRAGGGMAARYLDFEAAPAPNRPSSYTTPASAFVLGLGAQITSGLSLGAEANYRSSLISDTADSSSVDGAIRFTGTF